MLILNKKSVSPEQLKNGDLEVNVLDIARGLSKIPVYLGQTNQFYSYAEHALRYAHQVRPEDKLYALFNCAWRTYGTRMMHPHIYDQLELSRDVDRHTRSVLLRLQSTEQRDLFDIRISEDDPPPLDFRIIPMCMSTAYVDFLHLYEALKLCKYPK
jgi:hypothetical protein